MLTPDRLKSDRQQSLFANILKRRKGIYVVKLPRWGSQN